MKRILLPTDFSDNSWSAAVYTLKLYIDEVCMFYFLHATHKKSLKSEAFKSLLQLKEQAEESNANANHSFDVILSTQNLKSAIKKAVKKHKIDVTVMGTKVSTMANKFFFVSNTLKIVKRIKTCPFLIIPEEYDFVIPKQVAFPTDYNRFYSYLELDVLKDFVSLYNSKIRIVHINVEEKLNDIQEYNIESLKNYLEDYEYSLHWMPKYTNKAKEINAFIEDLNIDILIMIKNKHSFFEKIIKEDLVKKLVLNSKVPFLIIPNSNIK